MICHRLRILLRGSRAVGGTGIDLQAKTAAVSDLARYAEGAPGSTYEPGSWGLVGVTHRSNANHLHSNGLLFK
jgi:hypothetical protein